MSSMFIKCTSRDNNSRNEPTNANTGRTMEDISKNIANMSNDVPADGTISFQVTACKRQEGGFKKASAETLVADASDVEASTSTALNCRNLSSNSLLDRRQPLVTDYNASRSSCKRKPALPKKRPSTMQEPVIISAETGEAVDDDTAPTEDSVCSSRNTVINRDCRFGLVNNNMKGKTAGSTDFCKSNTDLQRLLSTTEKCVPPNFCGATNAANITNKYQKTTDAKICKLSEQFMDQRNGSGISNLNDVLILNAAVNSFLWANAAAGTDGANAFITPEMLASLSTAGLSPSLGVPCTSTLTDSLLNVDQQQNANMLLLEAAAAATAAGTIRDLLGITSTNGSDATAVDVMSSHKPKLSAIPSTSATAEIIATSAPNIFFNDDDDGISKKHDQRLGNHSSLNGRAASASENVVNMLNLGDVKRQPNKAVRCKISDVKLNVKRRANEETLSSAARAITKEEKIDLDELENFAQTFKKQRIKFGFTQGDVGLALGRRYGTDFSQTTISRFEALNLSFKNMCKLRPLLKEWLEDAEAALANGATISDLLDAPSKEPTSHYPTSVIHLPLNNNKPSSVVNVSVNSGNKMPSDEPPSPNGSIVCSSGAGGGVPLKKRRKRTNLDLAQRSALDAYFDMNPRPDHDRMAEIAELVGLDRDVVRVWFCNRRQKLRKE
ncbi:hypothetical protein LOAG_04719 [Loa loa]|uniref:POU domain protein n=1 Tax=Loa loa TaxID=7209 RepID=A0A1S0U1T4_LOALO|nr:hypothetical protein LOAG_04719 [Loa loa]EFO23767.2 hypothetical protein LOAG_04719 [Loa loa]